MNFSPLDISARLALSKRPRLASPAGPATGHVVLIPSYNTGARLFTTVAAICRQGWPVQVVIDGSTDWNRR